jgi:rare lipoprotein A
MLTDPDSQLILFLIPGLCHAPPPAPPTPKGHPKPYRVGGTWYKPMPHARDFSQQGIASWYGKKFHGRKTSSGEVYNMYAMTAAHKTLPLGTWVGSGAWTAASRLWSGSMTGVPLFTAESSISPTRRPSRLGMVGAGTARVEIVALGERHQTASGDAFVPMDYYNGAFTFQVGAFSSRANAERLRAKLDLAFTNAHVTRYDRGDASLLPGSCGPLRRPRKRRKV